MNNLPTDNARCARQHGMTLIEILVAIVVLSVGLLGLAGLQLKGLQVNQGSIYRWQAAMLAEDIADRIRADRLGALGGAYTLPYAAAAGAAAPTSGGAGTQAAINDWLARVATLPGGAAGISAPTGLAGNQVAITVAWVDTRAKAGVGETGAAAAADTSNTFVLTTGF
jgi:type IV pilus assembly protein PilV